MVAGLKVGMWAGLSAVEVGLVHAGRLWWEFKYEW